MKEQLTEEEKILAARREYHREYRKKNRKKILENQKKWRDENPDKIEAINRRHWLKKAEEIGMK